MTGYIRDKLNIVTSFVNPSEQIHPPQRKVLVIQCHPRSDSFSKAISDNVIEGLNAAGHDVRTKRLYSYQPNNGSSVVAFPATLSSQELESYMSTNDLTDDFPCSKEVQDAINDLKWCNALVFIYPTWWSNFPALLKGYFDRVLLPGVAFRVPPRAVDPTGTILIPGLTNIKKIGVVSTYGARKHVVYYTGDLGRRFLSRGFRSLCHEECTLLWHGLYNITNTDEIDRSAFLLSIKSSFSKF